MGNIIDANLRKGWGVVCSNCKSEIKTSKTEITVLVEKVRLLTLGNELGRKKNDDPFGGIFDDLFGKKKW
jgi:hypothetical protein